MTYVQGHERDEDKAVRIEGMEVDIMAIMKE